VSLEKTKKYEDALMTVIGFEEGDLEANAEGRISEAQTKRLLRVSRHMTAAWAIPLLGAIVALTLCIGTMMPLVKVQASLCLTPIAILVAAGIVLAVIDGRRTMRLRDDLSKNRVAEVEGRVELSVLLRGRRLLYGLRVGEERFSISKQTFLSFKNGDPYRVYYAPRAKRILSVEWLRDDNPFVDGAKDEGDDQQREKHKRQAF
jgi:hypothetical protein